MLANNENNNVLKSLVGNVEWILCRPDFQDSLRIVFRVDGKLSGFVIYPSTPTKYGFRSVEKVGPTKIIIEHFKDRRDILALVSFLDETKLTDAEREEWKNICRKSEQEEKGRQQQLEADEQRRKRQQYEQLKKELGEE